MSTAHQPAAKADRLAEIPVTLTFKAVAARESDGSYSIAIPALPGCVSQGDTVEEATANIIEAAEGWSEAMHDKYLPQVAEDFTGGCP